MVSVNAGEIKHLLKNIRSGEFADEAFAELVQRYMPLMKKRVAMYFDSAADVAEAMQEANIALHSAAKTYDSDKCDGVSFGLYAGVCISNRLKSMLRHNARVSEQTDNFTEAEKLVSGVDVESVVATRDLCDRVMKAAKALLSDFEFRVFSMSFERYSTKDIASALGRTQKSIDNAKFRISQRLRDDREICEILSEYK